MHPQKGSNFRYSFSCLLVTQIETAFSMSLNYPCEIDSISLYSDGANVARDDSGNITITLVLMHFINDEENKPVTMSELQGWDLFVMIAWFLEIIMVISVFFNSLTWITNFLVWIYSITTLYRAIITNSIWMILNFYISNSTCVNSDVRNVKIFYRNSLRGSSCSWIYFLDTDC